MVICMRLALEASELLTELIRASLAGRCVVLSIRATRTGISMALAFDEIPHHNAMARMLRKHHMPYSTRDKRRIWVAVDE